MAKLYVASPEEYKVDNLRGLSRQELEKLVKRTAGAANARLARLEKYTKKKSKELGIQIDLENYGAYVYAQQHTQGRIATRFRTGTKGKTDAELRREYQNALHFLGLKTSTVQGVTESLMSQYTKYAAMNKKLTQSKSKSRQKAQGEKPISFAQFYHDRERAWASNLKDLYDSDIVMAAYMLGEVSVLEAIRDEVIDEFESKKGRAPSLDELRTGVDTKLATSKTAAAHPHLPRILSRANSFRSRRR